MANVLSLIFLPENIKVFEILFNWQISTKLLFFLSNSIILIPFPNKIIILSFNFKIDVTLSIHIKTKKNNF